MTDVDFAELRKPFPSEQIGKLPRVTCPPCSKNQCNEHKREWCDVCKSSVSPRHIHIDFVGHADVTSRLLEVDPEWSWKPKATDPDPELLKAALASGDPEIVRLVIENAPPKFEMDRNGNPVGLWIKLTVGGVTRPGYGSVPSGQFDAEKVLIGDALRNAAMRFGVAVDLWAKGDRADPSAENATASAGNVARGRQAAGDAFGNASPATQRNGRQQGQVSRPAQQAAQSMEPDPEAQAFADEAHGAVSLADLEGINGRAREAGKLTAFVRNPAAGKDGKLGKLAVYLDWKRKQIRDVDAALAELNAAADARSMPIADLEEHVVKVTGASMEDASVAQLRQAAQALKAAA